MADDDAPKKKSKAKWIILLFVLLLLGGGAAGAWFFFLQDMLMPSEGGATPQVTEKKATTPVTVTGIGVPLPEFTTNLADPLGQRFIRINIEVEVVDQKVVDEMTKLNARIRDSVILLLSSKTYADVAGAENKMILKSEITDRLNNILGTGKVYQVFITNMVIQ